MLSLNREHSAAQRSKVAQSPLYKAAKKQVRADQSMDVSKEVRTYSTCMLRPVLFSWSMELLAFASRLSAPKMLDHLLTASVCHSNPFFLPSERSGRNRPLTNLSTSTAVVSTIHYVTR